MGLSLRKLSLTGLFLTAALMASTVKADISIDYGNSPQTPEQENVLFNDKGGQVPLLNNGPLIQGRTNQTDTLVDFFGAGEDLTAPSSGQARIEAVDGSFDKLCFEYHDQSKGFQSVILNINAEDPNNGPGRPENDGTVKFTIYRTDGTTYEQTLDLDDNGQNFFTILAYNNQCIKKVCLDVYNTGIKDIRQVRVSECVAAVPLPAAAWMGLSLLGAMGARQIRNRRKNESK